MRLPLHRGRAFARYAISTSIAAATILALAAFLSSPASAAPSCAEGPQRVGDTIVGTPCGDVIHAAPGISSVDGGAGNDTLLPAAITLAAPCDETCKHLGVGSQTFEGGPGNDVIFGERGNDTLKGGGGDDSLYGGIGDDVLRGGPGDDLLSGGFGADYIDGEEGSDFVRGDATLDRILDSGGVFDDDTLSYATGVTPGFSDGNVERALPGFTAEYPSFPPHSGQRGVYLNLEEGLGDDGAAPDGGGVDGAKSGELTASDFETIVGSPFSDLIVSTSAKQTIYGGGGADVILGHGGGDIVHGGADGDSCEADGAGAIDCETSAKTVVPRDTSKVSVGVMAPGMTNPGVYVAGSEAADDIRATYATEPTRVVFLLATGSFDQAPADSGGCSVTATEAVCALPESPDSLLLAGLGGNDTVHVDGFPDTTSIIELGGDGEDSLTGGSENEDVLADGAADDHLFGLGGDDALLNKEGEDEVDAGAGSDLLLSDSLCDGDSLYGGEGDYRDNASWTKLVEPVEARLDSGAAGEPDGEQPACPGESLDGLLSIEDLEGSAHDDVFYGDADANQLLGHFGADAYYALGGDDTILANSEDTDLAIDCGEGEGDTAFLDIPTTRYADPPPTGCENVYEAAPNDFQPPGTPLGPTPSTAPPGPAAPKPRPVDRKPPRTKLLRRPAPVVYSSSKWRRVAFAFGSSEGGSTFSCRIDSRSFRPCQSPRGFRLRLGRHVFRVFAVDLAGNRDRSPASFSFRIRRRQRPLEPKPPPPRLDSLSASTSTGSGRPTGTTTSWAIRSPVSTRKVSAGSVLSSSTRTSPR